MAACSCPRRRAKTASSAASKCWRSEQGTNPNFALFALRNESDQQIERLLVAPFFRLPGSGMFQPDLGNDRLTALTPSAGIRPVRLTDSEADVFEVTLDPGATVTFVAELTSGELPELYLWQPNAYRDYVNSFTLFRGVVLGVASLAAVFLTIMFVVKGRGVFPATAAFAWAVLVYLLIDFGVLGRLLGLPAGGMQPLARRGRGGHRHDAGRVPVHLSQPPPLAPALHPPGARPCRAVPGAVRLRLFPARHRRHHRAAGAGAARASPASS